MSTGNGTEPRLDWQAPQPVESEPTRLLNAQQVADRWGVPPAHVLRLARDGRLDTVKIGKYRRWKLEAIERFENDGGTGGQG